MSKYEVDVVEDGNTPAKSHQKFSNTRHMHEEPEDRLATFSGNILDKADAIIYTIVGISFLIGALVALGYSFWNFSSNVTAAIAARNPTSLATAVIEFVSGLLLVLIIMEVLGTVIHYLKSHETSLRPFLFIGIVSATRSILSIGARLSVGAESGLSPAFESAMIELGVSALVILALGITLKLLGRLVEDDSE